MTEARIASSARGVTASLFGDRAINPPVLSSRMNIAFPLVVCCMIALAAVVIARRGSAPSAVARLYSVAQKAGHKLMTIILSNLNRFTIFYWKISW